MPGTPPSSPHSCWGSELWHFRRDPAARARPGDRCRRLGTSARWTGDDVLEDKPGTCPICKMTLQPFASSRRFRADSSPSADRATSPASARSTSAALVPMTVNRCSGTVAKSPRTFYPDAGKCPDGRPREEKRVVRAHGDHNPRHGGQFFMAEDKLASSGRDVCPTAGPFRVFFTTTSRGISSP